MLQRHSVAERKLAEILNFSATELTRLGRLQKMQKLPRLAGSARVAQLVHKLRGIPSPANLPKIGIFVQMMDFRQWPGLHRCISNIMHGASREGALDLFFTVNFEHFEPPFLPAIESVAPAELRLMMYSADEVGGHWADNQIFLQQLAVANEMSLEYDFIVKVHTIPKMRWRDEMLKDLCGSMDRVQEIINQFQRDESLGMVGPANFTWSKRGHRGPNISLDFTLLRNGYPGSNISFEVGHAFRGFNKTAVEDMRFLWSLIGQPLPTEKRWTFVAGSMYWMRGDLVQSQLSRLQIPKILATCGSQLECQYPSVLDMLIPTFVATTHKVEAVRRPTS